MNQIHTKRLNGIDAMKFLMAFAVVFIHIQPIFDCRYPGFIDWIINLAVPYFFVASGFLTARGYYSFASDADRCSYLKYRSQRFGKMFAIWLLIYLPLSLINFNYGNSYVLAKDIAHYFIQVVLFGESDWAWPLWYLYSSMFAYFILFRMSRFRSGRSITFLVVVLIIICQLTLPYFISSNHEEYLTKGIFQRILGGLPNIYIGFILFEKRELLTNWLFPIISIILSYLLFIFKISIFPLFGGAALFFISFNMALPDKNIFKQLNIIGIWIYLTHMFDLLGIKGIFKITNIHAGIFSLMLIASITTFLTSSVLYYLSKTKVFNWLRKLI